MANAVPHEPAPTGDVPEREKQKAPASEQVSTARPLPPTSAETLRSEEAAVRPRWFCYEGEVIGSYRLGRLLSGTDHGSVYLSEYGDDSRRIVIKLYQLDVPEAELQLSRWAAISQLSNAHLIRLFVAGRCEMNGVPLLYVVMERAEENLSSVLAERCLSETETRELLNQVLKALAYLHETGYVHGAIKPSNIMASGDTIKLSSDRLIRVGEVHAYRSSDIYDPPEWAQGMLSPAGDIWSLGITLVQAVTQRLPDLDENSRLAIPENLPDLFWDIIQHCVEPDPHARWTVAQIASRLRGSLTGVPDSPSEPPSALPLKRQDVRKWLYAAVLAIIAVLLPLALKPSHSRIAVPTSVPPSAPRLVPKSHAATEPQAPKQDEHRSDGRTEAPQASRLPSAAADASRVRQSDSWFVVVATYARRKDAEKRAQEIARRWPQLKTHIYAPRVENPHYLVIIGSNLSEQSALALENQARAAGLPRDTYVKRFPK